MYARRRHAYFLMMGACLTLFVSAWAFVRLWSVAAAVAMCVVAMVIPPCAAVVANRRGPDDRWWDEPGGSGPPAPRPSPPSSSPPPRAWHGPGSSGDEESDRWWRELDELGRR
ncbi:DUF3099 domain-containing protein [Streptomyces sp. B1866]|uniref:DUF3099 domain-containing protein n=1 Tax=Streptomyces sp. B1866 TaxID=3075431 RepID=UPI002892353B|nr:DUF3099 domain-containing protein [Streptomyces sp. B1866]MDT3399177.1 DUF3099 domain-containing protein [Streptomyces sp. B1866]